MGIYGIYVKTFKEGNLASCVDINLDAKYPHVFFDVISITDNLVKLKSHWDRTEFEFPIKKGKYSEYTFITQQSPYGECFGWKPKTFKIVPMKGERI